MLNVGICAPLKGPLLLDGEPSEGKHCLLSVFLHSGNSPVIAESKVTECMLTARQANFLKHRE